MELLAFLASQRAKSIGVCAASLLLFQCVSEREILGQRGPMNQGGGAGTSGGDGGASSTACYEALARGVTGDACSGTFNCSTVPRGCCNWSAACENGVLTVREDCTGCECQTDPDCAEGFWCIQEVCAPCEASVDCAFPLLAVPRNGCTWCVPLGDCAGDADCPAGNVCYAGLACLPGCSDPSCCFGSLCGEPGCGRPVDLDCSLVGCADSGTCDVNGDWQNCTCTGDSWSCSADPENACVPN
jgi:hypothetical protein